MGGKKQGMTQSEGLKFIGNFFFKWTGEMMKSVGAQSVMR